MAIYIYKDSISNHRSYVLLSYDGKGIFFVFSASVIAVQTNHLMSTRFEVEQHSYFTWRCEYVIISYNSQFALQMSSKTKRLAVQT